jgi:hypothetical protein
VTERPPPAPPGFLLDGLAAEVERCASCGARLRSEEVPAPDDAAAWARLAREHEPGCRWVRTRARPGG